MHLHDTYSDIAKLVGAAGNAVATIRGGAASPLPYALPSSPAYAPAPSWSATARGDGRIMGMAPQDFWIILAIGGLGLVGLLFALRR